MKTLIELQAMTHNELLNYAIFEIKIVIKMGKNSKVGIIETLINKGRVAQ